MANLIAQAAERLASEQTLRRSEEYYRSLIEQFFGHRGRGRTRRHGAFQQRCDVAAGQYTRRRRRTSGLLEYVHPDDRETGKRALDAIFEIGTASL